MKKILTFIICVCLLTALAVPALAAGSASLSVSDSSVHRGDTFTVTVSVSGVDSCRSGGIEVTYDSKFELTGGEWLIDGAALADFSVSSKDGVFALDSAKKLSGKIFKLTFKVKSDAAFASGQIGIKLSLNGEDGDINKTVKVTVSCDHKYGSWNKADSNHSRKCSICGNVETKDHSYDHDCDTTCNDCGATRTTTHSFGTEWLNDETGHWHACTTCGEKADFAAHVPGAPAGEYTDQTCTVCDFVLATALGHQHSYDDSYVTDAGSHWKKCLGCGEETEHIAHSFDNDCDTTCDTCGYERAVLHNIGDKWAGSTQAHWKVCEDCGARLEQNDHIWDGGTVTEEAGWKKPGKIVYHCGICKEEWTDEIPALSMTQAMSWWVWLLIGVVCGVVLTVGVGLAIILPNTLRKSKGRFSN